MAKSAEDFAAELLIPIAAIAAVVFFIQKIIEWIWKSIAPHAIPILWGAGMLFVIGIACFILFMRAGKNRVAWKSFAFALWCAGIFGIVVYGGKSDGMPWARQIVESTSWVIEHPVITCIAVVVFLILAVTIPVPGLGRSRSTANSEFMRGFEDGKNDQEG